jgi:hypothetical protein
MTQWGEFASFTLCCCQALNSHQDTGSWKRNGRLTAANSMDGPSTSPASEVPFRITFSGHGGHLRLDPTPQPASPIPDFVLVRS